MAEYLNKLTAQKIPRRISGLNELSHDLWWSWHHDARKLFKALDRSLWKTTVHNPVKLLNQIAPHRLIAAAEDTDFVRLYDSVWHEFEKSRADSLCWCRTEYPLLKQQTIAYFSMEFAIHSSLPLYAGGLGVLAGDYCKEANDLGVPLIGVGFMYPQGYFQQHINESGWQEEIYRHLNFNETPIIRLYDSNRKPIKVTVEIDSRTVAVAVWQVNVGNARLYLLDTHLEENSPVDRELSARLYGGNSEMRLAQEIILGIGGVRILRQLNINPSIWHGNEGHTSFMMLERCRELVNAGLDFDEAMEKVQATSVFTTHTPVPAGNDAFPLALMDKYFANYWSLLLVNRAGFMALGTYPGDINNFNMTALGMRMADHRNGVSQLHGAVCRRMWHGLWPGIEEKDVPIIAVTNGVHVPSWISPQMANLFKKYIGPDWLERHDEQAIWDKVKDIPYDELWRSRRWLKQKMLLALQSRARERWSKAKSSPAQALAAGALLDAEALTIGFCRRFTDYKRPWLVLQDVNRLKSILNNERHPVQIIFSGKSHPKDQHGKSLIQQVYNLAKDPEIGGRVVFVEDYDLHLSRYLVQGVDLWLNTPRQLQEASGTSGMKAAINGVPNLSVMDGWWYEGYNGNNGWLVRESDSPTCTDQDKTDAEEVYSLLENKIVPLYYHRERDGIPYDWLRIVKESIRSVTPLFSARRMLKDYIEQMYLPVASINESEQGRILETISQLKEDSPAKI